ncbi:hypothetical protein [Paraburkholderia tropica]|uniref:hypothetical protein n=1 Tax=Paraburkholderia tropica TaxID=92647 RepID=UPI0007ED68E4|nr:hypothetical protein [Paraburkholderia tropica]OBR54137.1 hypothetical protein A6456_37720 [Paraburkholderia tropica]
MTDDDRKELMDLIAEYGTAAIIEGSTGRIRQFKRIVKHVEMIEQTARATALEQSANEFERRASQWDYKCRGYRWNQQLAVMLREAIRELAKGES